MSDKHRKWLVQFAYLVIKLDLRASKDYDGIKVDLPSRSFGTATMNIWAQIKVPGHPRNRKLIKPKNSDNTTAKLEIIFGVKYLPTLRRYDEIWRLLDWNCTNWWRNWRKTKFSKFAQILLSAYWPVGMTCRTCDVFLLVAWKNSMMPF